MTYIKKTEVIKNELAKILRYGNDSQVIMHNLYNLIRRYEEGDLSYGKVKKSD